jgi:periplasmic divalent cation tolerance protein
MEDARALARSLIGSKLAACVSMMPVESIYTWDGETEESNEVLLLIKTRVGLYPDLEKSIRKIHKYETPEIIEIPITGGLPDYLRWIDTVTGLVH